MNAPIPTEGADSLGLESTDKKHELGRYNYNNFINNNNNDAGA